MDPWTKTALLSLPIIVALFASALLTMRVWQRWKSQSHRQIVLLLWRVAWRLGVVAAICGVLEGVAVLVIIAAWTPKATLLIRQLSKGMVLGEVKQRAIAVGFDWKVRTTPLDPSLSAAHIMCHTTEEGYDVCEHWADATSFARMLASHACHVDIKDNRAYEYWLYMD